MCENESNSAPGKDRLESVPEIQDPLQKIPEIAAEVHELNQGQTPGKGLSFQPAQWKQGKWQVFGLVVLSSTGEVVIRVPRSKRLRDRNKYDSQGRLKSTLSEPE